MDRPQVLSVRDRDSAISSIGVIIVMVLSLLVEVKSGSSA